MKLAITDTETASLKGGVVDFAFLELDENLEIIYATESLIDPVIRIEPAAQAIHGISQAMVADAPTAEEFLEHYKNPFDQEDLILVGHLIAFDVKMLRLDGFIKRPVTEVCTLRMARDLWPDIKQQGGNHKLTTLCVVLGLEIKQAHRAMGDALMTQALLKRIVEEKGITNLEELVEYGSRPMDLNTRMWFGKHEGLTLDELPISYVRWCLNQEGFDEDLKLALAKRL